jgi:hypothetical protein
MLGLKLWRELIAAGLSVALVLFSIDRVCLGEDLPGELLGSAVLARTLARL